jgi:hypothetical protein
MTDEKKPPEPEQEGQGSELQHLLKLISLEYEAAHRGLQGLAQGVSKHEFITKRMEAIGQIQEDLEKMIGPEEARRIIVEHLNKDLRPEGDQ